MKLLSKELVSLDYRENLQRDLAKATVCRFLVAYISGEGMNSIGRHLLNRVLQDQRSFGVASLTCSCGFEALLRLQSELPETRLKYFMDPLVKEEGEPSEISLFHSKLVYLYLEREAKSVVYIGSHNWTRRAMGPQGPRMAQPQGQSAFGQSPWANACLQHRSKLSALSGDVCGTSGLGHWPPHRSLPGEPLSDE